MLNSWLFRYARVRSVQFTSIVLALCAVAVVPGRGQQSATLRLTPQDTYLGLETLSHASEPRLVTVTRPDYQLGSAILLKFDLSALPAGAVIAEATLRLALIDYDKTSDELYTVQAHKLRSGNPVVARATGYTSDGSTPWTPSTCCFGGVPLAQADISYAEDSREINKTPGDKSWVITEMVREWQAAPATNFGVLLNADATKLRVRYRTFASSRHPNAQLRPYLELTFAASDAQPPNVVLTAPAPGAAVSQSVSVTATASDSGGVSGVQFYLDDEPLGTERREEPYTIEWNTASASDGVHRLSASARDLAGNVGLSPAVTVTVANGVIVLRPDDTSLNVDSVNYSRESLLTTYTWPDNRVANAALLKFDLSTVPPGSVVEEATLHLALVQSDSAPDLYTVGVHKIVGKNPVLATATGNTIDGVTRWTTSNCCHNNVPLAQADISFAHQQLGINTSPGFKTWTITAMVQDWLSDPASNFGLLVNSDASKLRDRYRYFASMEHADATLRPYLRIRVSRDSRPPAISAVLASSVGSSSAVITWTTDEPGDTQVDYGVTTAYGQTTTANSSLVTSHAVTLAGLQPSTQYYFRVRSRDQAGNLATSGGFIFTTLAPPDVTAPTVTISAPAGGATVSGTVTVSATATDNVGVSSVEFRVDGASIGTDSTVPYSASWNTTTAAGGSHTLTAVARDAAGNVRTSAAVSVTVSNAAPPPPPPPPPAPGGLAARYPGDSGIENDPSVVFVEKFEESTLSQLFSQWTDVLNGSGMAFTTDVPAGSSGSRALNIPWVGGGVNNGGHLYKQLTPGVDDTLYVRYYIKYPTSGNYSHASVWMGGSNPSQTWPNPQAGSRPTGNDRFIAAAEHSPARSRFDHYNYWMNMRLSGDGQYWGNHLLNSPSVQARTGQWMCVEQMVKLNNPVSASNGEHAIWLDGVKVSHLGQGFPTGSWSNGIFTQSASGTPFEGFRWRSDGNLDLNWIWLQNYAPNDPSGFTANMMFDHLVVATTYIGCLTAGPLPGPGPSDTTAPSVSLSSPAAGATVSGTVTVNASASDNVGVTGVQFRLDGANVGAEDTSSPYSLSWNTATVANGAHVLTAVARDAAGNTRTSTATSVTVSNESPSGTTWPNLPFGLRSLTTWGFDQAPPTSGDVSISGSPGWRVVANSAPGNARGWLQMTTDPTAPVSSPNVYDFVYPAGMLEGVAPATVYWGNINSDEVFVGFWWKASSPTDLGPNGVKLAFLNNTSGGAGGGQQFMILRPDGRLHVLPEYPGDFRWRTPNINATPVTLGVWHRIEWYVQLSTGTLKWWMDGILQGSYTDVRNSVRFDEFKFSPTFGGNIGARKAQTDHYWYDHVHLSAR